jgi:(hydroxyamino)benzene mutase
MSSQRGGRQLLIHGMALIFVGLVWGLVVPHTPYPRLALGAHIQFVTNGLLFVVMASLVLKFPHDIGSKSAWIMLLSAWLTWLMALSETANAWWGTTQILPIAANQAGATGGAPWQELVVTLAHVSAGLGLIVAWALLIVGFVKHPADPSPAGR